VQHLDGPDRSNPMDPNSPETGNTILVLSQVSQSPAGVAEHWKRAIDNWQDLQTFLDWGTKGKVATLHSGTIVESLW
jgi:hypothetical protein